MLVSSQSLKSVSIKLLPNMHSSRHLLNNNYYYYYYNYYYYDSEQ